MLAGREPFMPFWNCESCECRFEFGKADQGQFVECPQCRAVIQIPRRRKRIDDEEDIYIPFEGENADEVIRSATSTVANAATWLKVYAILGACISAFMTLIFLTVFFLQLHENPNPNRIRWDGLINAGVTLTILPYACVLYYASKRIQDLRGRGWGYAAGLICIIPGLFLWMYCVPLLLLPPGFIALSAMNKWDVLEVIRFNRLNDANDE